MAIIVCPKCGAKNRVDERANMAQPVCGRCGVRLPVDRAATHAGKPVVVTDANMAEAVFNVRHIPVLVDCWAEWCQPCHMIAPAIDQLAAESDGKWKIAKLNIDQNPRTAGKFQVDSIPTLLIFQNGRLVDRIVGVQSKEVVKRRLSAHARA